MKLVEMLFLDLESQVAGFYASRERAMVAKRAAALVEKQIKLLQEEIAFWEQLPPSDATPE